MTSTGQIAESEMAQLLEKKDKLEKELLQREEEFQIFRVFATQMDERISQKEGEIAGLKEELKAVTNEVEETRVYSSSLEERLQQTMLELEEKCHAESQKQQEVTGLTEQLQVVTSELGAYSSSLEKKLQETTSELEEKSTENQQLRQANEKMRLQLAMYIRFCSYLMQQVGISTDKVEVSTVIILWNEIGDSVVALLS